MQPRPLRVTVIGSYPFPGWLEHASQHLDHFGARRHRRDAGRRGDGGAVQDQSPRGSSHHRRRADPARLQPVVLRVPRRDRAWSGAAAPVRAAGARPARQARHHRRAAAPRGSAWSTSSAVSQRLGAAGRALKASVPGPYTLSGRLHPERPVPRPVGDHRGAAAAGPPSWRRWSRPAAPRSRRRAVDELLRPPRGPGAVRRHLQPHRGAGGRASGSARTCASATTRAMRSLPDGTPRCSLHSSTLPSTRSTSRWPAARWPSWR